MLAVKGGNPIIKEPWTKWPLWDESTALQLQNVLESGRWAISGQWMGQISKGEEFEKKYAAYNNVPYSVVVDHATSGLIIALESLNIGSGDEVIVPALTWVATAIAVCEVNAVPILVDIDPDTYCISPSKIKEAITEKTKAIIPVHLYGCMADMDEIMDIANQYHLYVIEDASHVHGAVWNGKKVGSIGDIGVFSFQQGKVLTSGEGGAVLTKSKDLYNKLIELRSNSRAYIDEKLLKYNRMQLIEKGSILGSNYCISEFQAAILLDQLKRLDSQLSIKEDNVKYLNSLLKGIPGLTIMKRLPQVERQSYYRYAVRLDNHYFGNKQLSVICKGLEAEISIEVEQPYKPIHKSPLYRPYTKKRHCISDSYIKSLDVSQLKLPIAEKAHSDEGIIFHHGALMGSRNHMDCIYEAFLKIQTYSHELE